jgi:ketosteroid isomerase-like protein
MAALSIFRRFEQASCPCSWALRFAMLIVLLVLSLPAAHVLLAADVEKAANLSSNKEVALKFSEEVLNKRKIQAIDDLVQPDAILQLQSNWHSPISGTNQVIGKDNWKKHYEAFFAVWDKKAEWFKTKVEEVVAEGDTVAVRAERVYMDRKSKAVVNRTAMVFYKFKEGKIAAMYLLVAGPTEP